MTVDQKSIDAMANIMNILNQQADEPAAGWSHVEDHVESPVTAAGWHPEMSEVDQPIYEAANPVVARNPLSDPSIDAMKSILERFHSVSDDAVVERLTEAAETDHDLREALITEKTDKGARIGKWEIVVKEGRDLKTYDVVSQDGTVIASDLYLYEAAYGLVKRLNQGNPINSPTIREMLKLEEDYARNRNDAAGYKARSKKHAERGESQRAAVAEDRFDEAQRQALAAHEEILRLAGLRK